MRRVNWGRFILTTMAVLIADFAATHAQPNPYRLLDRWAQLPASMNGGKWGEVIGVKPGPDDPVNHS